MILFSLPYRIPSFSDLVFLLITAVVFCLLIDRFAPEQMLTILPGVLAGASLRAFGIRVFSWQFFVLLPIVSAMWLLAVQLFIHLPEIAGFSL